MSKSGKPNAADKAAAANLQRIWNQRAQEAKELGERFTQDAAAEALGYTQGMVSQCLNGTTKLGYRAVLKFAKYLRVAPTDIRQDLDALPRDSESDDDDWPDILAYRQPAALGDGAVPDDYAETHALKFRADSLRRKRLKPDRLGVCYGKGDSMLPRIRSGDAILFDMNDTEPKDECIFVISYDGELLAKKLVEIGGRWHIESLNKDEPKNRKPKPIDEFKQFRIHGRVRWIGSWED